MACIGSSRLCARVEKLCQSGHFGQLLRKKFTTSSVNKFHPIVLQNNANNLVQHCKNDTGNRERRICSSRTMSWMPTQQPGSLQDYDIDPYQLLEDDLKDVYDNIKEEITMRTQNKELRDMTTYYFDGKGKAIRPMMVTLMARAVNYHKDRSDFSSAQRQVAMISEMIHTASLIHDDVIDQSTSRRGRPSINMVWNQKKVAMAGNFVIAVCSIMMARIKNNDVSIILTEILQDLVNGEFMQMGAKETDNERFAHYLKKTYKKTGSLMANPMKAVALLAGADERLAEVAYQYGRNVGLGYQLVDDLLDFTATSATLGKPAAADLNLGLATAPVLFACDQFPELNAMVMRRFKEPGDAERAYELVHKSQGLEQTKFLARKHCHEAARHARMLAESPYQKGLVVTCDLVLNRLK